MNSRCASLVVRFRAVFVILASLASISLFAQANASDPALLSYVQERREQIRTEGAEHESVFQISHKLRGEGRLPKDAFGTRDGDRDGETVPMTRGFPHQHYHWKPSGLHHQPLYFEDVSLERYGQTHVLQPLVSAAKFYGNAAILPYKMGVDHPRDCVYTLGYARPGNCACPVKEHLPFSLPGAILQAGASAGFVFLFP